MSLDRYKKDLERLASTGALLLQSMAVDVQPEAKKLLGLSDEQVKKLPIFVHHYQQWYSEALACITQLLPARVDDFVSYYKPDKPRKDILFSNYTVSDYLKGVTITRGFQKEKIVGPDAALYPFQQQVQIVEAAKTRLESSLFDIRALVQADLFDSELDAAEELNHKGFQRGAGAMAGVLLEGHLQTICEQHKIKPPKNPSLSDLNDLLKKNEVLDVANWRFIQHLGDLRNLCDHKKSTDPTKEQIHELIEGVRKVIKTVF
jgi:hypothetical protein